MIRTTPYGVVPSLRPYDLKEKPVRGGAQFGIELTQRLLEGDVGAIITVAVPFALVLWLIMQGKILPAMKWKSPPKPNERTYFYRKSENEPPSRER